MRKIAAGLFVSLDGVAEAPETWHMPYFTDEMGAAVGEQMQDSDTMLLGRGTYEGFAEFWPNSDDEAAEYMNGQRKVVVSSTLENPTWQNTSVVRNLDEVRALKAEEGGTLGITGSLTLVRSLLEAGLLDELNLMVHPIVVGKGKRLFEEGSTIPLTLTKSETFANGVLNLQYRRADAG